MSATGTELKSSIPEFCDFTTATLLFLWKCIQHHPAWPLPAEISRQKSLPPHYGNWKQGIHLLCLALGLLREPLPNYVKVRDRWCIENFFLTWEILCIQSFMKTSCSIFGRHNRNCAKHYFRLYALEFPGFLPPCFKSQLTCFLVGTIYIWRWYLDALSKLLNSLS